MRATRRLGRSTSTTIPTSSTGRPLQLLADGQANTAVAERFRPSRFGVAVLDAYLEFLAVRSRPNTVAAVAYDLRTRPAAAAT